MLCEDEGNSENTNRQIVPVQYEDCKDMVQVKPLGPERPDNSVVKSATEVRHGTVHFLAHFAPLQHNTNLNIPPSNWLRSSSELEQRVKDLTWQSMRRPSEFSSFGMANNSLDLAGEVDVISNAENIKKLLKIPFGKSHISMMVHRIGKSLLLDDFDIHKHLLRREHDDWAWLREFYHENVFQQKMKCVPRQRKSRHDLSNRNMYSKFLYHSMNDANEEKREPNLTLNTDPCLPSADTQQVLPDPLPKVDSPEHHREVLWTFEDIRMLIGTDLPIFCNDSYYVSLRLRDMRTPISVLTGLDYWLDNLMCNVPEVAMCFHINGIVQKYEVLQTEDIPHLNNSQFNPLMVTDIAKNILSFLKTNATREGHTYWLYKGVDDEVVKLYDLTALCADSMEGVTDNPFTVPVGMLLYRVARNLRINQGPHKAPVIRTLLENCLFLLDEEKHPQVCTSASYLMSDLFVPDTSLQDDWNHQDSNSSSDDSEQDLDEDSEPRSTSVDVETLCMNSQGNRGREVVRVKPITESTEQRCREALKFIHRGLTCLNKDLIQSEKRPSRIIEEQAQCNSAEPIPMNYEPIHKTESSKTNVPDKKSPSVPQSPCQLSSLLQMMSVVMDSKSNALHSWHQLSKTLLYRKASMTFVAMAKLFMSQKEYGSALRCLQSAFQCYGGIEATLPEKATENLHLLTSIYGLAGDIRLILSKMPDLSVDMEEERKEASLEEVAILDYIEGDTEEFKYQWAVMFHQSSEINLQICLKCYQSALEIMPGGKDDTVISLTKRLGNAQNELGVWYMQQAQQLLQQNEVKKQPSDHMKSLWTQSRQTLTMGVATFESIADTSNQVLLHCNLGRLMRLCAQTYTQIMCSGDVQEFTDEERKYFRMAIDKYKQALCIGTGTAYKTILESVSWELSTTYFNMATLLQDYAPLSSHSVEEVEKEIIDLMNKSLKYCKSDTGPAIQPMYQYRAATINHRLASLFHNAHRNQQSSDQRKKHLRQLAESHYERAVRLFRTMECSVEALRVQLERLALVESSLAAVHMNPRSRIRVLLQMMHLLINTEDSLRSLLKQLDDPDGESKLQSDGETVTGIIESRLQFILLHLVKAYKSVIGKKSKHDVTLMEDAKRLYSLSLQHNKSDVQLHSLRGRCLYLLTLLTDVSKFYQQAEECPPD